MIKFFRPQDFGNCLENHFLTENQKIQLARMANARLELAGKTVYGNENVWGVHKYECDRKTALLINIEIIKPCTHPSEMVQLKTEIDKYSFKHDYYQCVACNLRVKPGNYIDEESP